MEKLVIRLRFGRIVRIKSDNVCLSFKLSRESGVAKGGAYFK
jgi:hypothetical protein